MAERNVEDLTPPDANWRAVMHILQGAFPCDSRVWRHVDFNNWSLYFDKILSDQSFSGGELTLLRVAASLFSDHYEINLSAVAERLSDKWWKLFLEGLAMLR